MNKKTIIISALLIGLSCARGAPVANQEQAVEPQVIAEPETTVAPMVPAEQEISVDEEYHQVQPVGVSYVEVWSNAEQLRVSVYGNDVEGNKIWELRWSRFEDSSDKCLFEQFYAKSPIREDGLWEIIVTDNDCNSSVDSVVEFFNRQDIRDATTMEGINQYMATARANFNAYPCYLENEIEKWHERNR
ncbi:MAG: hypothetical protein KJ955_08520 [Nanoarchaeota archaeon]|nr:hypothetical protein [Nanoarchaeota archaeon]